VLENAERDLTGERRASGERCLDALTAPEQAGLKTRLYDRRSKRDSCEAERYNPDL
jgi:hypothetical protein